MKDSGRIIGGVVIALLLGAVPAWVASARDAMPVAQVAAPKPSSRCVMATARMRRMHPTLLADWRHQVVRDGARTHHTDDGRALRMSLTGTCLDCHGAASGFCDRCHVDVGVSITCWSCHSSVPERVRALESATALAQ